MAVILDISLPPTQFEVGCILAVDEMSRVTFETMVPLGEQTVPFVRHYGDNARIFEESVSDHDSVNDIHIVSTHDGEILYALDWEISSDTFFAGLESFDAQLLSAHGTTDKWMFELRFPNHETVSKFRTYCVDEDIPIVVAGVYNPTKPDAIPWFGLTPPQREMLSRAVEAGYYSIPREISTNELAEEFDISDQAVTERLRRGIRTLTESTLLVSDTQE